jgi:hypothetical protein
MNTPRALIFILAVSATLLLASTATPATAENKICPTLTGHTWHAYGKSGKKYNWEVIGTAFTCGNAKHFVLKLQSRHVHGTSRVPLKGGPSDYHCVGTMIDSKGYPYGGVCYQHSLAFPKNGFSWSPAA